jgi:sulfate adenylyltransferase subunit 1
MSTLRFTTCGSVDDGKSTLIGRLLFDARGLLDDQVAAVERTSERAGHSRLDLSLFTDGLTIEREQGITVDVAYRYFATPRRRFIIADTPGHEQYTRNMVTGASTADLSIVLVDAARGISRQTRRHAAIAALLAIPHVVLAVNKMDAVGYDASAFHAIEAQFAEIARSLGVKHFTAIPVSALEGDMVVHRGTNLGWYRGPTLLEALEDAETAAPSEDLRFPVQMVSRSRFGPRKEYRGYLGRVESGIVRAGDAIRVLPANVEARVAEIWTLGGPLEWASPGQSVTLVLDRQIDVSRGDVLVHAGTKAAIGQRFAANLAWMDSEPLSTSRRYWLKQGTRSVRARIERLESALDLDTLAPHDADELAFNDLGRVRLAVGQALVLDAYAKQRATGSFILVDEASHRTVAAGMIDAAA